MGSNHSNLLRCAPWVLCVFLVGCAMHTGCRKEAKGPAVVILEGHMDKQVRVRAEVVARDEDRMRGLMHRRELKPDAGMLFVYPAEDNHTFWMKNTHIPLDLIFIGENRMVVGIVKRTTPLSLERISVDTPSRYVLEVNAGFADRHKIREGATVRFEGIEATD